MNENDFREISEQLRKPAGELGLKVAEKMNSGNESMNLKTIESLNVSPGDNVLEIGMGNGFFVKNILSVNRSVKYSGIDYSELMVEESVKMNQEFISKGQANFYIATAGELPFEDKSFNKLFTVNTIYFWDNPQKTIKEFHRVLSSKGLLIISLRPKWNMENIPFANYGFTMYTKEEAVEFISNNGFEILSAVEHEEMGLSFSGETAKRASIVICAEKI